MRDIKTAAVLGAGTMGAGIAALLAGVGIKVHLLDIVPKEDRARGDHPKVFSGAEATCAHHALLQPRAVYEAVGDRPWAGD
jgi:3-hydroxyacyl-CoA dehydrogenase